MYRNNYRSTVTPEVLRSCSVVIADCTLCRQGCHAAPIKNSTNIKDLDLLKRQGMTVMGNKNYIRTKEPKRKHATKMK